MSDAPIKWDTEEEINWDCLEAPSFEYKEGTVDPSDLKSNANEIIPLIRDPLDIEAARALLPWEKIQEFKKEVQGFEVVTLTDGKRAMTMAMQARKLAKSMEATRKQITKPALDFQKAVKALADSFIKELKDMETSLLERKEALNESRLAKSIEIGVDLETIDKVEEGSSFLRESWHYEVEDFEKIPKEYLMLDDKKVAKAISDKVRDIEGLRIFKETKKIHRLKGKN